METEHSRGADASNLVMRESTTYDANYRITESLNQYYDAGLAAWINQSKRTIVYDAQGNITLDENFNYDSGLSQWVIAFGTQYVYTYNAQNQILTRTSQNYNTTLSVYENDYREINYTYNSYNNPLTWSEEEWDGAQWVSSANYTYVYDVNGFPTSAQMDEWDNTTSTFIPAIKYDNVSWYNWNGDLDESLIAGLTTLLYNTTTSSWDPANRQTITYGANNSKVTLIEVYENGVFVNSLRSTENIDYQGRTTFYQDETWDNMAGTWGIDWQNANVYTYDVNDNLTQEIYQSWNQNTLALENNLRIDYADFQSFDNTTGIFAQQSEALSVYPNPMNESVTISTSGLAEKVSLIQLIDMNGIVVKSINNPTSTSVEINRDGLTSGCYFVQVKAGATVLATTKLLVD